MRVAIVGTTISLSENEERDVRQLCANIIKGFDNDVTIISGGAVGVDKISIGVAKGLGYDTKEYFPDANNWKGFSARNKRIAKVCDQLFCISVPVHKKKCYHHNPPQEHERTAGCWTLIQAKNMGKPCQLFVTPSR